VQTDRIPLHQEEIPVNGPQRIAEVSDRVRQMRRACGLIKQKLSSFRQSAPRLEPQRQKDHQRLRALVRERDFGAAVICDREFAEQTDG
jgi:hypothetical protein